MSETNEDWRDEMLVLTHEVMPREDATAPRALRTVTLKPTPALELNDIYSDEGDGWAFLRAHIKGVALHGGEGTAFVDGLRYHVRRATRAERLGQEDREHEEECRIDHGVPCEPDRCTCALASMGAQDEDEGRSSSDAYDEENLREQLAEALDALRAIVDGGSWHDDGSFVYWPADEDDDEDEGAIGVAATILAKHGRG